MITAQLVRELNRILGTIEDLQMVLEKPQRSAVLLACQQSVIGGGGKDHNGSVDAALRLGLAIQLPDSSLVLSDAGLQLLSLNRHRYYELQSAQGPLLFKLIVVEGPLRRSATDLSILLDTDRLMGTLKLTADRLRTATPEVSNCFNVLRLLGAFEADGDIWRLRPDYQHHFSRLRHTSAIGEAELRKILEDQAAFGRAAEVLTVEYERSRLRQLGAEAEALLVTRITDIDVGAGYDVESFDTTSSTLEHNRFIEVKASSSAKLRFFWTRNEYNTSLRLGPSYFIYFLGRFRPELGLKAFAPRIIQNPAATLPALPGVQIEPHVYLITEEKDEVKIAALDMEPEA